MKILKVMVIDLQEVIKKGPDAEFKKVERSGKVYTVAILPETTTILQANPNHVFIFFTEEENLSVQ